MSDGMNGQFVWHELMTTDAKAAAGFYSKVAKLKTQPAPFEKTYTMFVGSGRPMGGLMVLAGDASGQGTPPSWLSYVGTRDVDETARKAESLGGKVVKSPAPVPDGGRFAILQDPQGAVFAIYAFPQTQSGTAPSAEIPLGHSSWHELATTDHAAAFSFYQQLFGWHTTSSMDMGPQGVYRMFGPAGAKDPLGGMYTKAPGSPGGPNWLPYIKVADARPATKSAKSSGAQILNGPMQVPGGGWISMGIDPQGAMFAVHSVAAAAKPAAAPKKKAAPAKRRAVAKKATRAKKKVATKKKAATKAAPRRAKKKAGAKK
jgi:predicted enzyme related to lactoylglutathione lyase